MRASSLNLLVEEEDEEEEENFERDNDFNYPIE